ncbi:MAG: carboxypeptidase-like regulatory domain-containing protein [Bryobacteraceae bacterium]
MMNTCLFFCAYLFCAMALLGQGFGTIVGTVTDPSGAVIAGESDDCGTCHRCHP